MTKTSEPKRDFTEIILTWTKRQTENYREAAELLEQGGQAISKIVVEKSPQIAENLDRAISEMLEARKAVNEAMDRIMTARNVSDDVRQSLISFLGHYAELSMTPDQVISHDNNLATLINGLGVWMQSDARLARQYVQTVEPGVFADGLRDVDATRLERLAAAVEAETQRRTDDTTKTE